MYKRQFGNLASISGSSVAENVYLINGLDTTNFRNFTGSSTVPFEFYDTVEVKTGGYAAEFGKAIGGVAVTAFERLGGVLDRVADKFSLTKAKAAEFAEQGKKCHAFINEEPAKKTFLRLKSKNSDLVFAIHSNKDLFVFNLTS